MTITSVRHERRIAAPAATVWRVIAGPESIVEWFPGVDACRLDGAVRYITLRSGIEMPEEIVTVDATLRRFQYRITAPIYRFHLGTIDVHELDASSSLCVYSTTADPGIMAILVGGGSWRALGEIERLALATQEG